jgi:carbonic anhydrase/acetyltransferase-like protein (isoleucine patch superfamily)
VSKDPRQSRRPAGTPAGGQFAPTNRPGAELVPLVDDDEPAGLGGGDEPAGLGKSVVALHTSVLEDVVVEIEAVLGDDARDGNESAYWGGDAWKDHLEALLARAYESASVEVDGDAFYLTLADPRPAAPLAVTHCLRGFGPAPVPMARHTNPDGSIGGLVAETATVDESAWVAHGARVLGNAHVLDTSRVLDEAVVRDEGIVAGNAVIAGAACVHERGCVLEHAVVHDRAEVSGDAVVCSAAMVLDRAKVIDQALVSGYARIRDDTVVGERSVVTGYANVTDFVQLRGAVRVAGEADVSGRTVLDGELVLAGVEVA